MVIVSRSRVAAAVQRALALHPSPDAAYQAVAQSLCLPVEAVRDASGWCCPVGERLQVAVCRECGESSASYSSAMGPGREDDGDADSEGGETDLLETTS